ncbi:MAG: hypothetical protein U0795_19895 [Pirellulales bacterium]
MEQPISAIARNGRSRINVPISGLILTFRLPVRDHAGDLATLRSIPEIEVGEAAGRKLAIVVDSTSTSRDQEIWSQLWQLPSVVDVAVVMVAFEETERSTDKDRVGNQA